MYFLVLCIMDEYHSFRNGHSDIEIMLAQKKAEKSRRINGIDLEGMNRNDVLIGIFLTEMKAAADHDRILIMNNKLAINKICFLGRAMSQLRKKNLMIAFMEHNAFSIIADWLSPLPDKSLPALAIRESLLKLVHEYPFVDESYLKESGIGKAIMYLYKHPHETPKNKELAKSVIDKWSRYIFMLDEDSDDEEYANLNGEEIINLMRRRRLLPRAVKAYEKYRRAQGRKPETYEELKRLPPALRPPTAGEYFPSLRRKKFYTTSYKLSEMKRYEMRFYRPTVLDRMSDRIEQAAKENKRRMKCLSFLSIGGNKLL